VREGATRLVAGAMVEILLLFPPRFRPLAAAGAVAAVGWMAE